jgi:hypothetical protein
VAELASRIESLDVDLFEIDAQLGPDDRRSLLALHATCRRVYGTFAYLEIGSHLGGSLQVFVRDPACRAVLSIDPRPRSQPDERGPTFAYEGNSTERMLEHLRRLPGADLEKLTTFEHDTAELDPAALPVPPRLAFIDGEHTERAALRDAGFCRRALRGEGCIVFHDAPIVHRAISRFVDECRHDGVLLAAAALPNRMFAVELGGRGLLATPPVSSLRDESYRAYLTALDDVEQYRSGYWRPSQRVLRSVARRVRTLAWR